MPFTTREERRDYDNKWARQKRAKLKKAGLCVTCGLPKEGKQVRCEKCLVWYRKWKRKTYHEAKMAGKCGICTRPLGADNRCEPCRQYHKSYRDKLRADVISHYGAICRCCGETEDVFLCIDHINNDGAAHRRKIKLGNNGRGGCLHWWLRKNNYPDGFQVLCWNCNSAKYLFGQCPHQTKKCNTQ